MVIRLQNSRGWSNGHTSNLPREKVFIICTLSRNLQFPPPQPSITMLILHHSVPQFTSIDFRKDISYGRPRLFYECEACNLFRGSVDGFNANDDA